MILPFKNSSDKLISLRPPEPSDVELLYHWENNTEIWNLSNTLTPFSKDVLKKYIANAHLDIYEAKQLRLMIELNGKEPQKTIGTIDLFDFDPFHQRAGIGILIAEESERRKGYATDAIRMITDYAFNILQLHQIYCNIGANNNISLRLFQKEGFEITGTRKEWLREAKGYSDVFFLQRFHS